VKTVGDLMHKGVIACSPETPLNEIVRIINDTSVHAIMVMGPGNQPLGIITHMDIIHFYDEDLNQLVAREIMSDQLFDIGSDRPAKLAAEQMLLKGVGHLLVIERQGDERQPVGVISTTDLIKEMRGSRWIWHIG
jgi:predicted transcriptional regulator